MPIVAEVWDAFNRLMHRFHLEPQRVSTTPKLSEIILPVTQFDELLRETAIWNSAGDLSPAAGTLVVYATVPDHKRWYVRIINSPGTTAATATAISIGGTAMKVEPSRTAEQVFERNSLVLNERDSIGLLTTGNAGDNNRTLAFYYLEEDAF